MLSSHARSVLPIFYMWVVFARFFARFRGYGLHDFLYFFLLLLLLLLLRLVSFNEKEGESML